MQHFSWQKDRGNIWRNPEEGLPASFVSFSFLTFFFSDYLYKGGRNRQQTNINGFIHIMNMNIMFYFDRRLH